MPLMLAVTAGSAIGQNAPPQRNPSPLAPGDLKRPIFDTRTPVYEAVPAQENSAAAMVADVDGRPVTLADVADAIKELPASVASMPFADLFPSVVANLVRQQALVIRAQQQAIDEDPTIRRRVKAAGDRVLANEFLRRQIEPKVTERDLLDRYNKDIAGKPGPAEVHVRIIMAATEEAATALIAELRSGADFATLAKRSSQDTTAAAGGDLGYVRLEGLNAEVGAVAFCLQPGQFSQFPSHSGDAWFIVKVEDRRRRTTPSFSEERNRLEQAMLREGVSDVVSRALTGITVRQFNMSGKETTAGSSE